MVDPDLADYDFLPSQQGDAPLRITGGT